MEFSQGIKLFIFDFDGTLFDLPVDWQKLREDMGEDSKKKSLGELMQSGDVDLGRVTRAELEAVGDRRVDGGIVRMLHNLISGGFSVAVLTRNSRFAVERAFSDVGFDGNIYIVGREDVSAMKPHPEGAHLILDHFHLKHGQAVLVGDTYHDVEAAHAAGMVSVIVENAALQYTPSGADYYIRNLQEVSQMIR